MGIERHPALQPFSRDHVVGLFHAHQLMWLREGRARHDAEKTIENFTRAWETEISAHFEEEERLLLTLPVSESSVKRLLEEHKTLRNFTNELAVNKSVDICYQAGRALDDHIRWEEHHFFPEIERSLSQDQLTVLQGATDMFEQSRRRQL